MSVYHKKYEYYVKVIDNEKEVRELIRKYLLEKLSDSLNIDFEFNISNIASKFNCYIKWVIEEMNKILKTLKNNITKLEICLYNYKKYRK